MSHSGFRGFELDIDLELSKKVTEYNLSGSNCSNRGLSCSRLEVSHRYQYSFPVIHKVGAVGFIVLLKFEKLMWIKLSVTCILTQSIMPDVNLHKLSFN